MKFGDLESSAGVFARALEVASPSNLKWILSNGVRYHCKLIGKDSAYEFVRQKLQEGVTGSDAAPMLLSLADELRKDGNVYLDAVFREMAIRLDPVSMRAVEFTLAHDYAEEEELQIPALKHYLNLYRVDYSIPNVANNIGVIYLNGGQTAAAYAKYEQGHIGNNTVATGNLANALVHAGMTTRASELLGGLTAESDDEHIANARSNLLVAQAKTKADLDSLVRSVEAQAMVYQTLVTEAFSFWQSTGQIGAAGVFELAESRVSVLGGEAAARLRIGAADYAGTLALTGLFYDGWISEGGTLLGASRRRVLAAPTKNGALKMLIWPKEFGSDSILEMALPPRSAGGQSG